MDWLPGGLSVREAAFTEVSVAYDVGAATGAGEECCSYGFLGLVTMDGAAEAAAGALPRVIGAYPWTETTFEDTGTRSWVTLLPAPSLTIT